VLWARWRGPPDPGHHRGVGATVRVPLGERPPAIVSAAGRCRAGPSPRSRRSPRQSGRSSSASPTRSSQPAGSNVRIRLDRRSPGPPGAARAAPFGERRRDDIRIDRAQAGSSRTRARDAARERSLRRAASRPRRRTVQARARRAGKELDQACHQAGACSRRAFAGARDPARRVRVSGRLREVQPLLPDSS